ncbi:hypothetical protein [Nocardia salmonicida]|uniref:hypothetical protein n=1 Tax=Nocardia salmonicida TaxID=53431 RepID=UPI003788E42B
MTDLQSRIYEELRGARKLPDGLTSGSIAALPYICAVLGNGDPSAAYSTLVTSIRQHEMDAVTWAGVASLGLDPRAGRGSVLQ